MKDSTTTAHPIVAPKKLIEVALPLEEINKASAKEKSIRHGHPSTLHLWWARRPLAAARAVLFAQLVNDPAWKYSEEELKKSQTKSAITRKRNELFKLITQLVQWENINKEEVLSKARAAIRESWRETCEANKNHPDAKTLFNSDKLPPFHDPFAGGGSIPLEAQRLGLEAHATDLNPVAVLINKAMIELPPKFAGRPPVGPIPSGEKQTKAKATEDWSGARGLAEDVRRYGTWMREQAWKRIGHLYPNVKITKDMVKDRPDLQEYLGKDLTVVAWIWARTVPSPNPALNGLRVPLAGSFWLSQKAGSETWIDASVRNNRCVYRVRREVPSDPDKVAAGTKTSRGANFRCLASGVPITPDYIKKVGTEGGLELDLMAVVAEGKKGRVYLSPTDEMRSIASQEKSPWRPTQPLPNDPRNFWTLNYGLSRFCDLFTERQLITLTTLSDLVLEARRLVHQDTEKHKNNTGIHTIDDAQTYSDAVALYLAFAVNLLLDDLVTLATWRSTHGTGAMGHAFARQTVPMTWDFPEANPFASAAGDIENSLHSVAMCLDALPASSSGAASLMDATSTWNERLSNQIISTDPPYYDNISYADLSDFFYVWLRRSAKELFSAITATILTPKDEELIASPYRHGGSEAADEFFLGGMKSALHQARNTMHGALPITIYYAFKQSETDDGGTASTGWEVFLEAVRAAGFIVSATWPLRTERGARSIGRGTNALASSIVLVIRPRELNAVTVARKDFLRELDATLPAALSDMTSDAIASIAPVDLAQAAIGPGMAVFSKYKAVLEADGTAMSVQKALIHINKSIDDYFAHAEGDMDADTRFCIDWFQQHEFEEGLFGAADVLARAKGTAVDWVRDAGVIHAAKGKVRLLRVKEYSASWDPTKDSRLPIWEACHQMCRALGESESEAGALLARMPDKQDAIRQLAYRLYTICERKGWAEDARAYNELVTSWPAIVEQSLKAGHKGSQMSLL